MGKFFLRDVTGVEKSLIHVVLRSESQVFLHVMNCQLQFEN